jgi:hypothetical protein
MGRIPWRHDDGGHQEGFGEEPEGDDAEDHNYSVRK